MLTHCTLACLILVFTFLKGSKNPGILIECEIIGKKNYNLSH